MQDPAVSPTGSRPHPSAGEIPSTETRLDALESRMASLPSPNTMCLCVFSGELDRLLAAFNIATGAAAAGTRVVMFFTFWATPVLKDKSKSPPRKKSIVETLFSWMLPRGVTDSKLSQLEMGGLGRRMLLGEMKRKQMSGLADLLIMSKDLGIEILVCNMSMELMGIQPEELVDYPGLQLCGSARYHEIASSSATSLFI